MLKRAGKLLTVLIVAVLGVWGCAKGPAAPNGHTELIRKLESKCASLEEDYRAVASSRDDARKKSATVEEENKRLQNQLEDQNARLQKEQDVQKMIAKERDELRQQIESRINERDVLQLRCERLKKGLQNLLGQDEAFLSTPAKDVTSTASVGN